MQKKILSSFLGASPPCLVFLMMKGCWKSGMHGDGNVPPFTSVTNVANSVTHLRVSQELRKIEEHQGVWYSGYNMLLQ